MASSSRNQGGLKRCLQAFLAECRTSRISPQQWRELRAYVTSSDSNENDQVLFSACSALKRERDVVSNDEWLEFVSLLRREWVRKGNTELLERLQSVIEDNATKISVTRKRKRAGSPSDDPQDENASRKKNREDRENTSTATSCKVPAFFLLKTTGVTDHQHSVALDEIVIAGAELAIVCNYKFDVPWMWENAPAIQTANKVLIIHGESEAEEQEWTSFLRRQGAQDRVRYCRPITPPFGTVHSKMFVLFFSTGCRVCIHTANMLDSDWNYKTQAAYVRDFPLLPTGGRASSSAAQAEDDFKTQLERYFNHALTDSDKQIVKEYIGKFDFSSAGVGLVSSVPGTHRGSSKAHFGHARLRTLLREESFAEESGDSIVIAQFSSLGSTQSKWLDQEFKETLFSSKTRSIRSCQMQLVFPTVAQVESSNEGLQAGASLPVTSKNLERPHIVSKLHKWDAKKSGRNRAMPHIKTYLRYNSLHPKCPFWAFLGSFNLSVAAWGRMGTEDKRAKKGSNRNRWDRIHILSYEIGVLLSPRQWCPPKHVVCGTVKFSVPLQFEDKTWDAAKAEENVVIRLSEFTKSSQSLTNPSSPMFPVVLTLPIPYAVPPPKYKSHDVPWTTSYCTMS